MNQTNILENSLPTSHGEREQQLAMRPANRDSASAIDVAAAPATGSSAVLLGKPPMIRDDRHGAFFAQAAFHGIITSIDDRAGVFESRLWPMRGYVPTIDAEEMKDADGTFPIEAVDADDRALLAIGSVFTWMTGYRDGRGMPRRWESNLRIRRLPSRDKEELAALSSQANEYLRLFGSTY